MATYRIPAKGVRSIYGVNLGNTSSQTGEADEIVIDSPHELAWTLQGGVLSLRVTKKGPASVGARVINTNGMSIRVSGPFTTIAKPPGIVVSLVNKF